MPPAVIKPELSFEEYVDFCAHSTERYELVQGQLKRIPSSTVLHSRLAKFLEQVLDVATAQAYPEWEVFREVGQRTSAVSSRLPDLAIVPRGEADQLLKQPAVFQTPSKLVVELVSSSSASEDYADKLEEYQALGVTEIWIVDHEGWGAAKHIGFPKAPTLSIYHREQMDYSVHRFQADQSITSPIFPTLQLLAQQVFHAKA